jgi:tetratricopeptide (TPR) repeat protein
MARKVWPNPSDIAIKGRHALSDGTCPFTWAPSSPFVFFALNTPGTRALALSILGTIRVQQRRYQEGEQFLTNALALNSNLVGAHITLGEDYVFQNKLHETRTSFQEALRRDPTNFNARYDLAKVESSLLNFQESLEVLKPIEAKLSTSYEGLLLLAADYGPPGKKDELHGIFEKWQQLWPCVDAFLDLIQH